MKIEGTLWTTEGRIYLREALEIADAFNGNNKPTSVKIKVSLEGFGGNDFVLDSAGLAVNDVFKQWLIDHAAPGKLVRVTLEILPDAA